MLESITNNYDSVTLCDAEAVKDVPSNNVLVLPAELVAQTTNGAVLAAGLKAEDTESLRNNNTLLVIVWWWDTLEGLQAL